MSPSLKLYHRTHYRYPCPTALGPHIIRLHPTAHSRMPTSDYRLTITPTPQHLYWQEDLFGNFVAQAIFQDRTEELAVVVEAQARWLTPNPFHFLLDPSAITSPFSYQPPLLSGLAPYLTVTENSADFLEFMARMPSYKVPTVAFLTQLTQEIADHISHAIRLEPGIQDCRTTLIQRTGSCRDIAALFIQVLRQLGIAARFVSGYLIELAATPDADSGEPTGPSDSLALHAWVDVFLPGGGWIGLDPTSGLFAGAGYLPLACVSDPILAAPIEGTCENPAAEWGYTQTITRS